MRLRKFLLYLSVLFSVISPTCLATTTAQDIRDSLSEFLIHYKTDLQSLYGNDARIEHRVLALDSRLAMTDCSDPIKITLPSNKQTGRLSAKVSCENPGKWSIYIPIEIKVFQSIVVSATPISRRSRLTTQQLTKREMDISQIRGNYYFSINDVVNMEIKRQLKPGAAITRSNLRPPMLIEKGDSVVLSAKIGSLKVRTTAIAMSNGRKGQQIRVKNKQSKRIVDARVTGPGAVLATL